MSTLKYPWAVNKDKLERAITRACNVERVVKNKQEDRIKQLYISYGGKVIDVAVDTIPETLSATQEINTIASEVSSTTK